MLWHFAGTRPELHRSPARACREPVRVTAPRWCWRGIARSVLSRCGASIKAAGHLDVDSVHTMLRAFVVTATRRTFCETRFNPLLQWLEELEEHSTFAFVFVFVSLTNTFAFQR